ncbi:MAG: ribonuclease III [Parvibaculum sp.]|uniref:ribonuclease III n=1 Tax=Parvibaculum sp. TaxID=2024848 RepID=UPI0025FB6376|nr:ribonuclease III [Parvibaculum sp.]MCE9648892.1 ribonuclease III [Parvibaculum sp.]
MSSKRVSARALEARLGHRFADPSLLTRALSHSSAQDRGAVFDSNERLEFMGDRVLGLVIAEWLLREFPQADEGELAVRYNTLVRKEACAAAAERIELGKYLLLGPGEERAGGREKAAILADACEAVIAALYLDGGLAAAHAFIEAEWAPLLAEPAQRNDAKTALQEWTQGKGRGIPAYKEVERTGPDHAPVFTVVVEVAGIASMSGTGGSKRVAEQAAARAVLVREKVWNEND